MTKKAKFPAWTTKKVGSFLSNGKCEKRCKSLQITFAPLHANFNFFFSLAFQAWVSQNVLLLELLFFKTFQRNVGYSPRRSGSVEAQGGAIVLSFQLLLLLDLTFIKDGTPPCPLPHTPPQLENMVVPWWLRHMSAE
jgi:hypothetical protein